MTHADAHDAFWFEAPRVDGSAPPSEPPVPVPMPVPVPLAVTIAPTVEEPASSPPVPEPRLEPRPVEPEPESEPDTRQLEAPAARVVVPDPPVIAIARGRAPVEARPQARQPSRPTAPARRPATPRPTEPAPWERTARAFEMPEAAEFVVSRGRGRATRDTNRDAPSRAMTASAVAITPRNVFSAGESWGFDTAEHAIASPEEHNPGTARSSRRWLPVGLLAIVGLIVAAVAGLSAGTSSSGSMPRAAAKTAVRAHAHTAASTAAAATPPVAAARNSAVMSATPAPSSYALQTVPSSYLQLYIHAAREYGLDWTVLAAVGQVESQSGQSKLPGVASGTNWAGAAGPAQFEKQTWDRVGMDVDGRGQASPYDPRDAIPAMAAYLKFSGAPESYMQALLAYNHSQTYAEDVLALASRLSASGAPPAS